VWRARLYKIVENSICHRFIERAHAAIGSEIEFKRFTFDTDAIRPVIDFNPGKVGLPSDWAKGSKIVRFEMDRIFASGRIWKSFEARFCGRSRDFRFTAAEQRESRFRRHVLIKRFLTGGFKSALLSFESWARTVEPRRLNSTSNAPDESEPDRVGVIDVIAHDPKTDQVVLVMKEARPWEQSDQRLHELQERFNCYVSFLLDGEFAEWNPELARKRARIELRCVHLPKGRALDLLGQIRDQLAHQDIDVQVVVKDPPNISETK